MTKIEIEGRMFHSVEQYYQYSKALAAENPSQAQKILQSDTPAACKYLGDRVTIDENYWLPLAKLAMAKACETKFEQNAFARQCLLATGSTLLGEASENKTWGVGLKLSDDDITNTVKWTGNNELGVILMSIRDQLKNLNSGV